MWCWMRYNGSLRSGTRAVTLPTSGAATEDLPTRVTATTTISASAMADVNHTRPTRHSVARTPTCGRGSNRWQRRDGRAVAAVREGETRRRTMTLRGVLLD